MAITIPKSGAGQLKTKRGNRVFLHEKPKGMSRLRFGIICNYFDIYARTVDQPINICGNVSGVKDLYYQFYDRLFNKYGKTNGFSYIKSRDVLINPVGDLHSRRYFISDDGKKRLEELKKLKEKRIRAAKRKSKEIVIF